MLLPTSLIIGQFTLISKFKTDSTQLKLANKKLICSKCVLSVICLIIIILMAESVLIKEKLIPRVDDI